MKEEETRVSEPLAKNCQVNVCVFLEEKNIVYKYDSNFQIFLCLDAYDAK